MINKLLWKPTFKRVKSTSLSQFIKHVNTQHKQKIDNFETLHKWSIENRNYFWDEVWNFYNVIGEKGDQPYLEPENSLPGTKFFPNGTLNYAENMLKKNDNDVAITFWSEDKIKKKLSWYQLKNQVSAVANFFKKKGIKKGGLKNTSQVYMALGQAHFENQSFETAKKQFRIAARSKDEKIKKAANNWLKYTENEEVRVKNLALRRDFIQNS